VKGRKTKNTNINLCKPVVNAAHVFGEIRQQFVVLAKNCHCGKWLK